MRPRTAQPVQLGSWNAQSRIDHTAHRLAVIRRSARFGKPRSQLLGGHGTALGILRRCALRLADIAVGILCSDHEILSARGNGIKLHRHALRLDALVSRAGGLLERLVLLLRLMDAKHLPSRRALVIALRKALTGKRGTQHLHLFTADALAVECTAVNARNGGDVLRALHTSLELDAGHTHAIQLG